MDSSETQKLVATCLRVVLLILFIGITANIQAQHWTRARQNIFFGENSDSKPVSRPATVPFNVIQLNNGDYIEMFGTGTGHGILRGHPSTSGIELGSLSNDPLWFITNQTERMRIDGNGNVGIGTNSPGTGRLVIVGNSGNSGNNGMQISIPGVNYGLVHFGWGTTYDDYIRSGSGGKVILQDTGGNVGIGTASPDKLLTVQGSSNRRTLKLISDGDGVGYSGVDLVALTNTNIPDTRAADFFLSMRKDTWYGGDGSGPSFIIETGSKSGNNFSAPFTITPTNDILLNSGRGVYGMPVGNVGIGTASPAFKFDVYGPSGNYPARVGSPDGFLLFGPANPGWSHFITDRPRFYFNTGITVDTGNIGSYAQDVNLQTSGTTRMTISNSTGYVGIGTTGPNYRLDVNGEINATGLRINGTPISGGGGSQWGGTGPIYYTGGNVGIGTSSPSSNLQVVGSVSARPASTSAGWVGMVNGTTGSSGYLQWYRPDGATRIGYLGWSDGGVNNLGLNLENSASFNINGGNVGIGNSSPSTKLQVAGGTRVDGTIGRVYLGTGAVAGSRGLEIIEENATTFSIRHHDPNVAWQNIAINPYAGKVGIGTLSPTETLEVGGNIKVSASGTGVGNITAAGTIEAGNIKAKYQDVAEWVPSSSQLAAGTVVILDTNKSNQVTVSNRAYDTSVAGVVSEQPGISLGEKSDGKVLVATTGRVRVKVDASKAPINIGDLLVTSDIPGVAMKSEAVNIGGVQIHRPGTLIGKALEPLAKGKGEILVLLSLQ